MDVYKRGIKNAFRNPIRTVAIIVILGISMGVGLSMLIARGAVQDKINSVKSSVGNTITVSPAGARGFEGGGEALTTTQLDSLKEISGVASVTQVLRDRLTTENTNLVSAIDAGSLGQRAGNSSGVQFMTAPPSGGAVSRGGADGQPQITRTFTPPVQIIGANTTADASVYGGDKVTITSGTLLDANADVDEAMVGTTLAAKNSLVVGSTFTAYGKTLTVKAIYDAGNDFANNSLFVPLATLQRLSDQPSAVTSATVTTESIDDLDSVVAKTKEVLGTTADVVSNQENAKSVLEPLQSVKTISTYSLLGSLVAAAIIILLSMMMIVRERRREIGVMKAIGSTNRKTVLQFVTESVTLTLLGMVVAVGIGIAASGPITKTLVNNANSTPSTVTVSGPGGATFSASTSAGGGRAIRLGGPAGGVSTALRGAQSVSPDAGPEVLVYAVLAALFVAILGSAIPAFMISKVRPSESNESRLRNTIMIEVKDVVKTYKSASGDVTPVSKVSFTLDQGQFAAIVGKSGSGKSTLLSLLGALDSPTSGQINVDGHDITKMRDSKLISYRAKTIGFVFQGYNLVPNLTALENVMLALEFGGYKKSLRRARAAELLDKVGIVDDKQLRRPSRLSGGEQQRVAIARAIANKPKLILADEPTGNLDEKNGKIVFDILHKLTRTEKTTIVVVTHDTALAGKTDKTFRLVDGKLTTVR